MDNHKQQKVFDYVKDDEKQYLGYHKQQRVFEYVWILKLFVYIKNS